MDLTAALLRGTRPSVFMLTAPGATACRLAVERLIRVRGYRRAVAPAQANILLACGELQGELAEVADRVWAQLPLPATRGKVRLAAEVEHVLDRTVAELTDPERQRHHARAAVTAAHAHDDQDMGGMAMPGGLGMAERGPDRDGLSLDQLHVPLGPTLPHWPAGLRLRLVLQGDVVQEATCDVVGFALESTQFWTVHNAPAAALDSLQRLLSVAGWSTAALSAARFRDELLTGPTVAATRGMGRWARRVRRSRLLRWSTDGLGVFTEADGSRTDATVRWLGWLDAATGAAPARLQTPRLQLDALPALLIGQELAAVRLIVASLDPDLEALAAGSVQGPAHG